jgi:lipase maturation factor 1
MQTLLELIPKFSYSWLFNQTDISTSLRRYAKLLGILLFIILAGTLYQFGDMTTIDGMPINAYKNSTHPLAYLYRALPSSILIPGILIGIGLSIALYFGWYPFWIILYQLILHTRTMLEFETFFNFQWDILLIEVLFFSLLFISPKLKRMNKDSIIQVYTIQLLPFILLFIRLFYHSAKVKLLSKDRLWLNYTALQTHLFSQPMPHILAFLTHKYLVIKKQLGPFMLQIMFLIELAVPFGLFFRSYRAVSAYLLILLQVLIILTGNYGFFNYLTIVGLLFIANLPPSPSVQERPRRATAIGIYAIAVLLTINAAYRIPIPTIQLPIAPKFFHSIQLYNVYGLFAKLTKNQTRYNVAVSNNKIDWTPLKTRFFTDSGYPSLVIVQPYHPRIRWQLWFKFIHTERYPMWYRTFIKELAKDPNSLSTIIKPNPNLGKNYPFVRLCYQNVMFDLDKNDTDGSKYWTAAGGKACHMYDAKTNAFRVIK